MNCMFRRTSFFAAISAAFAIAICTFHVGAQDDPNRRVRKMKVPPLASRIEVTVLRDSSGKPIERAAVIFHPLQGERDHGVLELKTNDDGKAVVDVIPIGDKVRLQVIAKGFQTYGGDFMVDKTEISMEIRLKRPGEQYSIYKDKSGATKSDNSSSEDKSQKPAEGEKPKDTPKQQ
jgi:5-hydroxyisourate hydrolase-like protein (transthyretin family)